MIDLNNIIGNERQTPPEVKRAIDTFMSPEGVGRRYLLGRNEHSAALVKTIEIDGFIDDFAEEGTVWNDRPVVKGEDVPENSIVVNCSMSIRPVSAHKRIEELGVEGCLSYAVFCKARPDLAPLPNFVAETRSDLRENRVQWEAVRKSLFDEESRKVFDDVVRYRLTGDYAFMMSYAFRPKDQYFEDFLGLGFKDVFVDAGGYDGDTTEEFCSRYPDYEKVFFFEPSQINFSKARKRLMGYRSIEFIERGLSDSVGVLKFNPHAGPSSAFSESGSFRVDVTTLDLAVSDKVTFIKMDLEGWELKALTGSRRHILEEYPVLAVSVYHNPSDFWRTFELVMNLRRDYNVYLRHYSEGWSETVMYFVRQR